MARHNIYHFFVFRELSEAYSSTPQLFVHIFIILWGHILGKLLYVQWLHLASLLTRSALKLIIIACGRRKFFFVAHLSVLFQCVYSPKFLCIDENSFFFSLCTHRIDDHSMEVLYTRSILIHRSFQTVSYVYYVYYQEGVA